MKICLSTLMKERFATDIRTLVPAAELVGLRPDGSCDGDATDTEVLFFSIDLSFDAAAMAETMKVMNAESLRWVQGPGAGIDHPIWTQLLERGVRLSNASGIHAEPIAQYIFTYILHWERQVARHQRQQAEHVWEIIHSDDLSAKTLGIVGLGGIGGAAARVARAFGMRVIGLRRSDTPVPDVDVQVGPEGLHRLLGESDYVVLCMPLSDSTRHMIGREELAAMRENAVLINVARGGVVDEAALIEVLRSGAIRGASLDVTETEPLASDSPLWDLENCVLTPHDAGYSPLAGERLGRLFIENLAHYRDGERMRNEIDPPG